MGRRPFRVLAGLLTVALAGCAASIAPADGALSLGSTASAVAPASVTGPARTAKISSIRTTDATKGVITVIGTLSPAPRGPSFGGMTVAEADVLADKGGYVWGDVDSTGCSYVRNWLGNLTDGTARVSLHNGTKAMTSVLMKQETETWLNYQILGVTRLRLQVADVNSGYGPYVAVDSIMLCTN